MLRHPLTLSLFPEYIEIEEQYEDEEYEDEVQSVSEKNENESAS